MEMSIQVNDFRWEPGKNDAEYIRLLESSRNEWQKIAQKAIAKLKMLSKVQESVVHGRWKDNGNGTVSCSRCATWFPKEREPYLLFCGYCGAKMDGEWRDNGAAD